MQQICDLVAAHLSVTHVSLDQPLMEVGLDSYTLPEFSGELNAIFAVNIAPTTVLECGTVRAIAARLVSSGYMVAPESMQLVQMSQSPEVALRCRVGRWRRGTRRGRSSEKQSSQVKSPAVPHPRGQRRA